MDNNLEVIKDYIHKHSDNPPENLTLESKLNELGIDSLAMLELFFEFEDKYDIRLPQDIKTPETVGDMLGLIEQYQPADVNA